jgi:hypothetical protein
LDDDLFDERILGGGDFVEQVLGGEASPAVPKTTLAERITKVVDYYRLSTPADSSGPGDHLFFCHASHETPVTAIAAALGYSPSAVSKASLRGETVSGR